MPGDGRGGDGGVRAGRGDELPGARHGRGHVAPQHPLRHRDLRPHGGDHRREQPGERRAEHGRVGARDDPARATRPPRPRACATGAPVQRRGDRTDPVLRPPGGRQHTVHRDGREQRRDDLRRDPLERDRRGDPAAGAQRRADNGDPVRERAVHLPEGPDGHPALPGRRGVRGHREERPDAPDVGEQGADVRYDHHAPTLHRGHEYRVHGRSGGRPRAPAATARIPRMRATPQRHVPHSSCAGVISPPHATLVGAKTARGAARGRTRTQADRCPHEGVPDWPTAVRQ